MHSWPDMFWHLLTLVVLSGGGGDVAVSLAGTVAVAAQGLAVTFLLG